MSGYHAEKGRFDTMNTVCCGRPIIDNQPKKILKDALWDPYIDTNAVL